MLNLVSFVDTAFLLNAIIKGIYTPFFFFQNDGEYIEALRIERKIDCTGYFPSYLNSEGILKQFYWILCSILLEILDS